VFKEAAMQISRTATYVPTVSQAGARSGAATSPSTATVASDSPTSSDTGIQRADFTHMTRQGLFDWMNAQIKSGQMSLDDSSGLLGMTLKMPADGAGSPSTLDDRERVDFMARARDGMAWARQHGEQSQLQVLQKAMAVMQQHQGDPVHLDLRA